MLKESENTIYSDSPLLQHEERRKPRAWGKRNWFQLGVFLATIGIGFQFFIHVHQALGNSVVTVARPSGVEGFLPVHPAAMVFLGFACFISLALRKSFCGWFCPVGTLSEWLWELGRSLFGKNYKLPVWLDFPLRSLKYLLLGFFVKTIFSMSSPAILGFLQSPYYKISDVKMLHFFTQMSTLTVVVLAVLVLSSVFIRNVWCRYLCPYGALMGLLALCSLTRIQRNPDTCIGCKSCSQACPYYLPVDRKRYIISPECNGCLECTRVCPVESTLELKTTGMGETGWDAAKLGIVIIGIFIGMVYTAGITGHWKSSVTENEFRARLKIMNSSEFTHPKVRFK
ncbi:MAG: 4Fe-4S binding protein [Deltaproteobacteria bacterium]|nr:4Fe-4S binding protein [Deltaproteobacteria bacterium]